MVGMAGVGESCAGDTRINHQEKPAYIAASRAEQPAPNNDSSSNSGKSWNVTVVFIPAGAFVFPETSHGARR